MGTNNFLLLNQQLKECEADREKLKKIFDFSHDAIIVSIPHQNKILEVNDKAASLLGYPKKALENLEISDIHPNDMGRFLEFFDYVHEEGYGWTDEIACQTKRRELIPTEISASTVTIGGTECMIAIARDISERKIAEEKLKESETTYRDLFESAFDVVFMLDKDRNFIDVNRRAEELTGYTHEELMGKSYYDLVLQDDKDNFDRVMDSLAKGEEIIFDMRWAAKNGSVIHFEGASTPRFAETGEFHSTRCTLRDVTDREKSEEKLGKQLAYAKTLSRIDRAISGTLDLNVVLQTALDELINNGNSDAANVLILEEETGSLVFEVGRGFNTEALKGTELPLGEGLAGKVALERKTETILRLDRSQADLANDPYIKREGFISYYAEPLIAKGKLKGVLELFFRREYQSKREWEIFISSVATQIAIGIENSELFNSLEKSNIELVTAYNTTLEGWAQALDLRDNDTEGHTRRVTALTVKLARKLGITGNKLVDIRRGAILHDIGKMGIPDEILHKPGPLDESEWKVMKTHPILAKKMLSSIAFLQHAIDIPFSHHEKWDGSGYPSGLQGDSIPLGARLFAVCDVWDALISDRPYRKAWTTTKAKRYIRDNSGSHFDPQIAKEFLEIV